MVLLGVYRDLVEFPYTGEEAGLSVDPYAGTRGKSRGYRSKRFLVQQSGSTAGSGKSSGVTTPATKV